MHGNGGDDILSGGGGYNKLFGGSGADQFLITTPSDGNYDSIQDFTSGSDRIVFDHSTFTAFTSLGQLSAEEFHLGSRAQDANDHILYNQTKGNIYYDADGNGPDAAVLVAHVTAGTDLSHSDFFIG